MEICTLKSCRVGSRIAAALLSIAVLAGGGGAATAEDLSGPAVTMDGDTIEMDGERVRLHGIDAPEKNQTCLAGGLPWACGRGAQMFLAAATERRTVHCLGSKRDRYGRLIAVCFVDGRDINAEMVRQGWAVAYRQYAKDYVGEEGEAQSARRGLWQGEFVPPSEWRRGHREIASGQ